MSNGAQKKAKGLQTINGTATKAHQSTAPTSTRVRASSAGTLLVGQPKNDRKDKGAPYGAARSFPPARCPNSLAEWLSQRTPEIGFPDS